MIKSLNKHLYLIISTENIQLVGNKKVDLIQTKKMEKQLPKGYLFLHNIGKKNNIGSIVRSACAFGLKEVIYVTNKPDDSKKMKAMKEFHIFGNHGTYKQINFNGFRNLKQAKEYLNQNNIKVCGVEIGEGSIPIQNRPFTGNTAFFLGNQGTGIIPVHRQLCDFFVYIPQYTDKTASLNVSVAAGIIFHHFALWAGYEESKVFGQKFQLQENQQAEEKSQQNQKSQKGEQPKQESQSTKKVKKNQDDNSQMHN